MISRIPSSSAIQGLHFSVVLSQAHSNAFINLSVFPSKPAKVSVTEAVVNMNRTFDNTQLGSSFVIWLSNRVHANGPIFLWLLQFLMTNGVHHLWYVATPTDLAGNFLFQGFIHQPMWIRRTLNGEFIMMRNLWVAVIKFALTFIESFITHPFLLKTIDTRLNCPTSSLLLCFPVLWFVST